MFSLKPSILLASILFASTCYGQDSIASKTTQLQWKFAEDLAFKVVMDQGMSQTTEMNDTTTTVSQSTQMSMTWKVQSLDADGTATLESVLNRATMEMEIPQQGKVTLDTDLKTDENGLATELGKILRPMVNAKCTQKMTPNGTISEVVIPEDVIEAMKSSTVLPPGTERMLTDMVEKSSPSFPDHPLKVGETWTQEAVSPNPLAQVKLVNTYTYRGPVKSKDGKTLEKIDVDMKMDFTIPGATVKITDQKTEGSIFFDNNAGHINNSLIKQNITMEISAGPVTIKQNLQQDTTASFTRL